MAKGLQTGMLVDKTVTFNLQEMCEICHTQETDIIEMVNFGILDPRGNSTRTWKFSPQELQRFRKAARLQHDLELDLAGIALALDLLEKIDAMQTQMQQLQHLLKLFNVEH